MHNILKIGSGVVAIGATAAGVFFGLNSKTQKTPEIKTRRVSVWRSKISSLEEIFLSLENDKVNKEKLAKAIAFRPGEEKHIFMINPDTKRFFDSYSANAALSVWCQNPQREVPVLSGHNDLVNEICSFVTVDEPQS